MDYERMWKELKAELELESNQCFYIRGKLAHGNERGEYLAKQFLDRMNSVETLAMVKEIRVPVTAS